MSTAHLFKQRVFEMLVESQFRSPEAMRAFQYSQLIQLLLHARENFPFYETRLDFLFKKNGAIDWDRWHEIPIITRADLCDRRNELLAAELPPGHGSTKTFNSSSKI